MARLPSAEDIRRPVPQPQREITTDRSGEIRGAAIEDFGVGIARTGAQIQEKKDRLSYAKAKSDLLTADIKTRAELNSDQDWQSYDARYRERMGKALEESLKGIQGHTDKTLFQQESKYDIERGALAVQELAKHQEVDSGLATLNSVLKTNRDSALNAGDEATRHAIISSTIDALKGARENGYLSAQDEMTSRQKWTQSYAEGYLGMLPPDKQVEALKNPNGTAVNFIPVDQRAELLHKAQAAVTTARIENTANNIIGVFAKNGPDAGAAALEKLSHSGLPQDQLGDIYSKVQTGASQIRAQRQQVYAQDLSKVYDAVSTDQADGSTSARVDTLWKNGALSPVEYASLHGRVEESRVKGAGNTAIASQIRVSLESGVPLDPTNPMQRKALDATFAQDVSQVPAGSAPWLQAASAYAARTRVLPSQASSWARASLRSPNPQVAAPAAQFVASIQATAGDAASGFDIDTKAMAGVVNQMIGAGTEPAKAIEMARETIFNRNPAITDQRKKEYRTVKDSDSALDNFIDRDFDTAFTRQPDATSGLKVDFRSQVEQYYLNTGDLGLARELAWTDLKKVYGVSEVNGIKQMIAFPPERYGVKPETVRADVLNFLNEHPQADGSTANEITLVPDSLTLQAVDSFMNGQPVVPSYKLVTKSGDLVVDSKGIPKRYSLPNGDEMGAQIKTAQEAAVAKARQSIDDARTQREADRKRHYDNALKYH